MNTEPIVQICDAISGGFLDDAAAIARADLPFEAIERAKRKYTDTQSVSIFLRDGFIDRYSGQRLVFPGTLRLLSLLLPEEIPYQKNGKTTECHMLFWLLFPTVDHVKPVARGGLDIEANWVCTSMFRNAAKSVWTLEELGWQLQPPGPLGDWDGMLEWFMKYVSYEPSLLEEKYLKRWHRAAERALADIGP
ncbi:MAG: HNH endonuclease signature motif containing protein [Truepera sp.]|nr:HNH endonuclease signature motif containing protein [Truepera sp.]